MRTPALHQLGTLRLFGCALKKKELIIASSTLAHMEELLSKSVLSCSQQSVKQYGSFLNIPAARWQEHRGDKARLS